jgi:hypothetical protein
MAPIGWVPILRSVEFRLAAAAPLFAFDEES